MACREKMNYITVSLRSSSKDSWTSQEAVQMDLTSSRYNKTSESAHL